MRQLRNYVAGVNESQLPLHPPDRIVNVRDDIDMTGAPRVLNRHSIQHLNQISSDGQNENAVFCMVVASPKPGSPAVQVCFHFEESIVLTVRI